MLIEKEKGSSDLYLGADSFTLKQTQMLPVMDHLSIPTSTQMPKEENACKTNLEIYFKLMRNNPTASFSYDLFSTKQLLEVLG